MLNCDTFSNRRQCDYILQVYCALHITGLLCSTYHRSIVLYMFGIEHVYFPSDMHIDMHTYLYIYIHKILINEIKSSASVQILI